MSQDNQLPPPPDPQPASGPPSLPPLQGVPALPYASSSTPMTQDEKTMGILCGFLGPLILWLVKKDESAFVNDQGKEALNFQLTVIIAALVAGVSSLMCCFLFVLVPAIGVANLVFSIIGAVEANKGNAYRYPFSIRMIS